MIKVEGKPHVYMDCGDWVIHEPPYRTYSSNFKGLLKAYSRNKLLRSFGGELGGDPSLNTARAMLNQMATQHISIGYAREFWATTQDTALPLLTDKDCITLSSETIYAYYDIRSWFQRLGDE